MATPRMFAAVVGLSLGILLAVLDQTIVATALPRIAEDLGSLTGVTWVVTGYLLASTAMTPLYGRISDRYGRRRTFLVAIGIFTIASIGAAMSQTLSQLIAARVVQGIGAGGLFALALTTFADLIPPRDRGRIQGLVGGVFALGSVGGPLAGGLLTEHLDWRWIFYINLPLGLLAIGLVGYAVRLPRTTTDGAVDLLGSALLVGSTTSFLLVTVWGGKEYAWNSATIVALLVAAVLLLVLFVRRERTAAHPILPPRLFANPVFRVAGPASAMLGILLFGAVVFLPLYFQGVRGMSPTRSGLSLIPLMLAVIVTAGVVGRLVSRTGRYRWYPIAGAALLVATFLLLSRLDSRTPMAVIVLETVLLGVGVGLIMQLLELVVQNAVSHADVGTATSGALFLRVLGGAVGTAVFGTLLIRQLREDVGAVAGNLDSDLLSTTITTAVMAPEQVPPAVRQAVAEGLVSSISVVFLTAVTVAAALLILAVLLPERRLRDTVHDDEGPTITAAGGL